MQSSHCQGNSYGPRITDSELTDHQKHKTSLATLWHLADALILTAVFHLRHSHKSNSNATSINHVCFIVIYIKGTNTLNIYIYLFICLFIYLFICLFIYLFLFIHLFSYLFVHLFSYLFIYLFTYLLVYLFICFIIYLFIYLSTYLFIYLFYYLFSYLFICLFIYLFIYLFVCFFVYLFICFIIYLFSYLFVYFFVCLFICFIIYLVIYLVIYLFISEKCSVGRMWKCKPHHSESCKTKKQQTRVVAARSNWQIWDKENKWMITTALCTEKKKRFQEWINK